MMRIRPVNGEPGEIQLKGDNVFSEYWQRPKETASSFTLTDGFAQVILLK